MVQQRLVSEEPMRYRWSGLITSFLLLFLLHAVTSPNGALGQVVRLTDSTQTVVSNYYFSAPGNAIYVQVTGGPVGSGTINASVYVEIPPSTQVDQETVTLTENPANSGNYFGPAGGLSIAFSAPTTGNGTAEGKVGDDVVADYNSQLYNVALDKHPVASTLSLVDSGDVDKTFYFIGTEQVYVHVEDSDENRDPSVADTINVSLTTSNGDSETVTLTETGANTGIFIGSMASDTAAVSTGNGTLNTVSGAQLTATYTDPDGGGDTSNDTANFIGNTSSTTFLTDGAGTEQATFLIGSQGIYITVYDGDQNTNFSTQQNFDVTLTDGATGDTITVNLVETTNNSGIFRNTTGVTSAIGTATADAILQTENGSVIQASYTDPDDGSDTSSDTAAMAVTPVGSVSRFTDNLGNDVSWYTIGANDIYVTINDSDENTNTAVQTINAVISSTTGDSLTVALNETGGNTGIFRTTSAVSSVKTTPGNTGNSTLEVWPLENITVTYTDANDGSDISSDTAAMQEFTGATVSITNSSGVVPAPDQFTIAVNELFITVTDSDENVNASAPDTVIATFTVSTTGDTETITLTETGNNTGVFRNTVGLLSAIASSTNENSLIEATEGATITADYTDNDDAGDTASDTSTLVNNQTPAAIELTNASATPVTSYQIGSEQIYIEVDDIDENSDSATQQSIDVIIQAFATGDIETVTLTETGNDTGVFFNSTGLSMAIETRNDNNGILAVGDGTIIQVQYTDNDDAGDVATDNATVNMAQTSSACQCTDSTGAAILTLLLGNDLYVTVTDPDENTVASSRQSVIVTVRNDINFDIETLTLQETGNNTGIFRNTIGLPTSVQSGGVTSGDGTLEGNDTDGVTVTYRDNDTPSDLSFGSCTLELKTNATIKFTDITGASLETDYDIGSIVDTGAPIYIQVEDSDENHDPLVQEILYVNLSDLRTGGDTFTWSNYPVIPAIGNPVELTETTSSSGIFRSTTGLESEIELINVTDDVLQTIDGATIQAVYTDPTDPTDVRVSGTATMHILQQGSVNYFADNFGGSRGAFPIATGDVTEQVYLIVEDDDENTDPNVVNTVNVTVTCTATLDSDQFTLTEINPDTLSLTGTQVASTNSGFFIFGPVQSNTDFRVLNDGIFQVAHNSGIRMHYQDDDDVTDFGDDWATMDPPEDVAGTIQFTDAAGTSVTTYVIGVDNVYCTVTDPDQNTNGSIRDTVIVTLYSDIGDIISFLTCRETTSASGIFRNEVGSVLQFSATTAPDAILQTDDNPDNIHCDYEDYDTGAVVTDDATATQGPSGSMVRFTNNAGVTQTAFTIGAGNLYLTVWDADENNDAGAIDSVNVTVSSTVTGDVEIFILNETGNNTGIFRNAVGIASDIDFPAADAIIQCSANETIVVTYTDSDDATDVSTHAALMQPTQTFVSALEFVDASPAGAITTSYYIDNDLIFIRLQDADRNRSALTTDTVNVYLTDPVNGDSVTVTLYEVGTNSDTFENWTTGIPSLVDPPNTTNQTLETFAGAVVRVDYTDPDNIADTEFTTATMLIYEDSSLIDFTNQAGTTVTSYWIDPLRPPSLGVGELIYVTIRDDDENLSASVAETITCTITDGVTGDFIQNLLLTETGVDTGIFRNVVGVDSEIEVPITTDAVLQTAGGSTITVEYQDSEDAGDYTSTTATMNIRPIGGITQFTDIAGVSRTSYLIATELIYVTVTDSSINTDATTVETVAVDIVTSLTGDYESIVLTEISSNSNIFRNTLGLTSVVDVATASDGVLQTQGGDTIMVTYTDPVEPTDISSDTATMQRMPTNSAVEFIVATGPAPATPETTHIIRVDRILVEVYDPDENADPSAIDQVTVTITSPQSTDVETLDCYETGPNTGYFQSLTADGIFSDIIIPTVADGTFQTVYPSDLVVTYVDNDDISDQATDSVPTQMFTSPSSIWFSDVNGVAQTEFDIYDELVYLTLDDPDQDTNWSTAQTVICTIADAITGDLVTVTLYETSDNSGVFRNFINGIPSLVSTAITSNTTLETGAGNTISVAYQDPTSATETATDTATMLLQPSTSTVRFTDFFGVTASYYTITWDNIYVEVSDRDENQDGSVRETISCTIYDNDIGDYETVTCTETTSSSGIFRSTTLPNEVNADFPEDGILQTHDQSDVLARYIDSDDATDVATSTVRMYIASSNSSIDFIYTSFADGYYFGSDEVYVRVIDYDENVNPLTQESLTVTLTCTATGDTEQLLLLETGVDTDVFENSIGLATALRTTATPNNNLFEAPHLAVITATYSDKDNPPTTPPLDYSVTTAEARIPQTTATVSFTDSLGGAVSQLLAGRQNIFITVIDGDQNLDPFSQDSVTVTIRTSNPLFDQLNTVTLTEIGFDAGVFRNVTAVESVIATTAVTSDNLLQVREEVVGVGIDNIEVEYIDPDMGSDQATNDIDVSYRTFSTIAFTDASGTTLTTHVIGVDDIYVTVTDADQNMDISAVETLVVTIEANYNGDLEYLTLTETGVNTGIFRNLVRISSTYQMLPTSGDSVVQTIASSTPPPQEYIMADYVDPDDPADASSTQMDVVPQDPNDRDGDGMPNAYEDSVFGGDAADDAGNATQDFDGDGRINILEYTQGTDPTNYSDNGPTANPGPDQTLDPSLVQLDGSASFDPSTHTPTGLVLYQWSQVAGPATVTFSDPAAISPTFVGRTAGSYDLQLRVRDADGAEAVGFVTIDINDVPPMAEAIPGASVNYQVGGVFALEGRGSTDANDGDGASLVYTWAPTPVIPLNPPAPPPPPSGSTQTFNLPVLPGVYNFDLTVTDSGGNPSSTRRETVIVHRADINWHVPTADAGPDHTITVGSAVTLDGSRSSDYDLASGTPLTGYTWTFVSGPMFIDPPDIAQAAITPGIVGVYVFQLTVTDGTSISAPDFVTVVVNQAINHVPTADAGSNFPGTVYGLLTLDGSGSADPDGNPLTYTWTQTRGEPTPLSSTTTSTPSFRPISPGVYEFQLTVNDGFNNSVPDRVCVTVNGTANGVPIANAGLDQTVLLGTNPSVNFQLNGTNSYDPDSDPLTYYWRQIQGTNSSLDNYKSPTPTMVAKQPGTYEFELYVYDGKNFSVPDRVIVQVAGNNQFPVSNAGPDASYFLDPGTGLATVILNGSGSYDPDNLPSPLTYQWRQTAGPAVTLSSNAAVQPNFVANTAGDYTFVLRVDDGELYDEDSVTIHIAAPGNTKPVANAGPDQSNIYIDTVVNLDGSGSYDSDGDTFTVLWQQISGPASVVLSPNQLVSQPYFVPRIKGVYTFRLTVTGDDGSTYDEVNIYVVGGQTGGGGGVGGVDLGGGSDGGGGGGGCSAATNGANGHPILLLLWLLPLVIISMQRRLRLCWQER